MLLAQIYPVESYYCSHASATLHTSAIERIESVYRGNDSVQLTSDVNICYVQLNIAALTGV
jgi:hypothetical protein